MTWCRRSGLALSCSSSRRGQLRFRDWSNRRGSGWWDCPSSAAAYWVKPAGWPPRPCTRRASASIAQVHAARLRDGTEVVVKVRRPGLRRQFEADVRAMALLAAFGERRSSAVRAANARGFVELFAQLVLEEMDFRLEALNMVEIGLASEDAGMFDNLRVPRPVPGLVTPRVLVMEYLPGTRYTDAAGHLDPDVDAAAIIRLGIQGVLEHTLVYGIFHGDLHAGNVFLESDGRFVLLDFGIVGRLDAPQRAALVQFMFGVGTWDARAQLEGLRE